MPVELTLEEQPPALTHARVMRIEIEDNIEKSVTVYVSGGTLDAQGGFVEWRHPVTGLTSTVKIKLEDGHHPLTEQALGKCPICEKWWPATICPECDGDVSLNMYDGFARMTMGMNPQVLGLSVTTDLRTIISAACYGFLLNEDIPDPDTWALRKILSAQIVS